MKSQFLGDSYDAVKRMWHEMLADWAPLYAEPLFFPEEDEFPQKFEKLTGIQMLTSNPPRAYSILAPKCAVWRRRVFRVFTTFLMHHFSSLLRIPRPCRNLRRF